MMSETPILNSVDMPNNIPAVARYLIDLMIGQHTMRVGALITGNEYDFITQELEWIVATFWVIVAAASLLVATIKPLQAIATHGKTVPKSFDNLSSSIAFHYHRLWVSKSFFTHMYMTGMVSGIALFFSVIDDLSYIPSPKTILFNFWPLQQLVDFRRGSSTAATSALLFLIQSIRRYWECRNITHFGKSKIHLIGYLIGIIHYIGAAITLGVSGDLLTTTWDSKGNTTIVITANYVIAICLFAITSYLQYCHHVIFYRMKLRSLTDKEDTSGYGIPQGLGFRWVCCPHYSMEILIYISFNLLQPYSVARWCMTLWVFCNLAVVADGNLRWYQNTFDNSEVGHNKLKHWKRIIPLIW